MSLGMMLLLVCVKSTHDDGFDSGHVYGFTAFC